jgi:hypothetical protein
MSAVMSERKLRLRTKAYMKAFHADHARSVAYYRARLAGKVE